MPHAAQTCIAKPALQAMGAFHFSSFLGTLSRSPKKRVEQCRGERTAVQNKFLPKEASKRCNCTNAS